MPDPDDTKLETTPYEDEAPVPPALGPKSSDEEIVQKLGEYYRKYSEELNLELALNPEYQTKNLADFKRLLRSSLDPDNPAFKARFDPLEAAVVDEVAPQIFSAGAGATPTVFKNLNPDRSTAENVAKGGDPVNLGTGEFQYATTDFRIAGAGMDCAFTRTYSQLSTYDGPLGRNWDHSLNLWIRISDDGASLNRSTGALHEETFHRHEVFGYWVPPAGSHAIIETAGNSFVLRQPDGLIIRYAPHPMHQPLIHVAERIEDRFGNFLRFFYGDEVLESVQVNHPDRRVFFGYDSRGRIVLIRDFSGRIWKYDYDSGDMLASATMPGLEDNCRRRITHYSYLGLQQMDPRLQVCLTSIIDAEGRLYLENEYGTQTGVTDFRRVVRQRQGGGESLFAYETVSEQFDFPYELQERPASQAIVTEPNGHLVRHLFNQSGNMILREECLVLSGVPQIAPVHFRYNRDGKVIAVRSALGSVTQQTYGRDTYERQFPRAPGDLPKTDPNLTAARRQGFGQLQSVVRRGEPLAIFNLSRGLWSGRAFPDPMSAAPGDIVQKFTYEPPFGQLSTVSDPDATESPDPNFVESAEYTRRLTRYAYSTDGQARLVEVKGPTPTRADGTLAPVVSTRFAAHDARGRLLEVVAPNGLRVVHRYFGDGVLEGHLRETSIDPAGMDLRIRYDRDDLGRLVKLHQPASLDAADGRFVDTFKWTPSSHLAATTGTLPAGVERHQTFDRAGALTEFALQLKDADGAEMGWLRTRYCYDESLNRVAETQIAELAGENDRLRKKKTVYDAAGRPHITIGPTGRKERRKVDARGLPVSVTEDFGGLNLTHRADFDADRRLSWIMGPTGARTRYHRDVFGRQVETEDALGNRVLRVFDKRSNLVSERVFQAEPGGRFRLMSRKVYRYDELNRAVEETVDRFGTVPTVVEADLAGAFRDAGPGVPLVTRTEYDAFSNPVRITDPDGRVFQTVHDLLGRPKLRVDPEGNRITLSYDRRGNLVRTDTAQLVRDPQTSAVTGEKHFAESYSHDELNHLTGVSGLAGNVLQRFDGRGLLVERQDALGNVVKQGFDAFGRLTAIRQETADTAPATTRYAYDDDDRRIAQVDPLGRQVRFNYDSAGRLAATVLPDGSFDASEYDAAGNLVLHRRRSGLVIRHEFDTLQRPVATAIDPATTPPEFAGPLRIERDFDAVGRVTSARSDFVRNQRRYDSLDNCTAEDTSFTAASGEDPTRIFRVEREYSNTGALLALGYPSGRRLTFQYDLLDRVKQIAQAAAGSAGDPALPDGHVIADFGYEGQHLRSIRLANGLETRHRYDFLGRLVELRHLRGGVELNLLQIGRDPLGKPRVLLDFSVQGNERIDLNHDGLGRMTGYVLSAAAAPVDPLAVAPANAPLPDPLPDRQPEIAALFGPPAAGASVTFSYDLAGNRLGRTEGGATEELTVNALDQVIDVDGAPFRYDPDGALIEDQDWRYRYDHRSQLSGATRKADGMRIDYLIDADGHRALRRTAAGSEAVIFDGADELEIFRGGHIEHSLVRNPVSGHLVAGATGTAEQAFLADGFGSVRYLFEGAILNQSYRLDPFGAPRDPVDPADGNRFRYKGKARFTETGQYDFVSRTYDPSLGRFLQRDPSGWSDGTNLYAFLRNAPLTFSDPLGLESRAEHTSVTTRLGTELAHRNPKGFTLAVGDNYDREKIKAYRERIQNPLDRAVGFRAKLPGQKTSTEDIRGAYQHFITDFVDNLPGGRRPEGFQVDHTVELQHIIRENAPGANTVRRKDHRLQDEFTNRSQGGSGLQAKKRQIRQGASYEVPAGGVARESDVGKFRHSERYRAIKRRLGYYDILGGSVDSLRAVGEDIENGDFTSAGLNASAYLGGSFELAGLLTESTAFLKAGRFLGAPAAVIGSGVIGAEIGTNLYENYVDHDAFLSFGERVEAFTGSRTLGAIAAATAAVDDALASLPEAAYDYAADTWTMDPDEIDWAKTVSPWRWF